MEKVNVSIDGMVSIPALVDPDEHWNGFAIPWFTKEDVPLIQKTLDMLGDGDSIEYIKYKDEVKAVTVDSEYCTEVYWGRTIDGEQRFPIGGGSWIWTIDE